MLTEPELLNEIAVLNKKISKLETKMENYKQVEVELNQKFGNLYPDKGFNIKITGNGLNSSEGHLKKFLIERSAYYKILNGKKIEHENLEN
jgi:hypothetical protein